MHRQRVRSPGMAVLCIAAMAMPLLAAPATDSAIVRSQFAHPSRDYASAPLWVWNDLLTEEQITASLEDLAGQQVKQAFVHPRPGLMTPYLSPDWFRLWKRALREAERLDMNIWIYDENSYPSGFAGGLVPEALPDSRGLGLAFRESEKAPAAKDDLFAVFRRNGESYENVTSRFRAGEALPAGQYLVASRQLAPSSGWFGGKWYVDLLRPGVTEKFLEVTMEAYRREIGREFGRRVPGVFTDEPHLTPAGGIHWSQHLPELFQKRWGYDLVDHLPSLAREVGDWKRVRHNYCQLLLEQFIERWAKPFHDYCAQHNLEFTGHYWEHGWPGASHGGDNMAMYAWHQRPAIDTLMNQYSEDVGAQFGNVRAVLELASVANQLGCQRTLCEAYGAGGWDLRFEDMKRIGDWLYVLGVNTLDEHLSYITIRGARKRDHPQSFSYHEPWWPAYHVMAEYFTRLSLVLSSGQQVNRILVLEPTTSAWMYQTEPRAKRMQQLADVGNSFQKLVTTLAKQQVELDIGCEDIISRHGSAAAARLVVGQRSYDTVLLPAGVENLNAKTLELLRAYLAAGGVVFSCGPPPQRVDGQVSDRGEKLAEFAGFKRIAAEEAAQQLLSRTADGFSILSGNPQGILFHHRRKMADGEFLFLANTSIDADVAGSVRSPAQGIERWDPQTGKVVPYAWAVESKGVQASFVLPPCGSLLLFLSNKPLAQVAAAPVRTSTVAAAGPIQVRPLEPNVLTLDYVDVTASGESKMSVYFYSACQFVFQKNGMDGDPWDRAVQFRDELISKRFPPASGFEATYRFTIRDRVPSPLHIVIERPDLYAVTCNGKPVSALPGNWWLDRCFGRIDISAAAQVGGNAVTIKASPMTVYHELEPAYLLGPFALEATESGFAIAPDRPITVDKSGAGWNRQGRPFYAAGVSYALPFDVARPEGKYIVSLPKWYGSVARVIVNGKQAGHIAHQPWECDVTSCIQPGRNTIEVVVIGSLKNTLGPHHAGTLRGSAWPNAFQKGPATGPPPGAQYDTIDYGLFEPFTLTRQE